ncbi:Sulfotransferase domain protein [Roseovarius albus]|uniref:Sulfotransferase domain protein n=1 Tax=Roseovarius albus TaxID=1247867 RepID=A0A1X6ZRU2_9RHOB|nr:sulfotransferase [Roseovarius albus]SLN59058.1 Sulfotransferase domain protein [Roseovarius albus]
MSRQPNFFFIGGMRCGSTTLNLMLEQHPNIFMSPIKEPNFYVPETLRRLANPTTAEREKLAFLEQSGKYRTPGAYFELFEGSAEADYVGESSHYLYHPKVAQTIRDDCPNAKILVCLRNPADRLFSEYLLHLRRGEVRSDFASFVDEMASGFIRGTTPDKSLIPRLNKGLQHQLILPWIDMFGRDNVKLVLFENLELRPLDVAADIFDWLSIEDEFAPVVVHTQKGGRPKRKGLAQIFNTQGRTAAKVKKLIPDITKKKLRSWFYEKSLERPMMDPKTKTFLMDFYRNDVLELQRLIDTDLEHWFEARTRKDAV